MGALSLRVFAVLLAWSSRAAAQYILEWEHFQIHAELDNDGAVLVNETLTARVNGKVPALDRQFALGTGQEMVIRSFGAVEGEQFRPITDYDWRDRTLLWTIRTDDMPEWNEQTLVYRLQYELRGAVLPAWDIPAGPASFTSRDNFPHFGQRWREMLAAWREPRGRYRFDHDVLFARFESEGPKRLDYTFKYGTAWKHPQPEAPLSVRVTPDVDYRVTELRDYLRKGPPPAISVWQPQVRVLSMFVCAALALGLWLLFALGEIRRRGLFGPRLDREWFREHLVGWPAEKLALLAGGSARLLAFPLLLSRWRQTGAIAVREGAELDADGNPILHLRQLGGTRPLAKYEREVLRALFPKGEEMTSAELQQVYAKDGFAPGSVLDAAIVEHDDDEPAPAPRRSAPWFWVVLGRLMIPIFLAAAALLLLEAVHSDYANSIETGMYFVGGFVVLGLACRFAARPLGGLARGLVAGVPVVAAVLALVSLHFHHTLPLLPEGAAGLALLALGCVVVWLQIYRVADEHDSPTQQLVELGRRYVRRELRRAHPRLEDEWLPQIFALGFGSRVEKWRARHGAEGLRGAGTETLRATEAAEPFTGAFSLAQEHDWANALEVVSDTKRRAPYEMDEDDRPSASR
jgi:hypothetical protein